MTAAIQSPEAVDRRAMANAYAQLRKHNITNLVGNCLGWVTTGLSTESFLAAKQIPRDWHLQKLNTLLFSACRTCKTPLPISGEALIFVSACMISMSLFLSCHRLTKRHIVKNTDTLEKNLAVGAMSGCIAKALTYLVAPVHTIALSYPRMSVNPTTYVGVFSLFFGIAGAYTGYLRGDIQRQGQVTFQLHR